MGSDRPRDADRPVGVVPVGAFIMLPRYVMDLGLQAMGAWAALATYANPSEDRICFAKHSELAERAGMSVTSMKKALAALETAGAITVTSRQRVGGFRTTNVYELEFVRPRDSVSRETANASQEAASSLVARRPAELEPPELDTAAAGMEGDSSDDPGPARARVKAEDEEPGANPAVDRICEAVAEHVEHMTTRRPPVSALWRREGRLMLADGWTEEQVLYAVRWLRGPTEGAAFWGPNVLSVPKLRQRMEAIAARIRSERNARPGRGQQSNQDLADMARRFEREEAARAGQ